MPVKLGPAGVPLSCKGRTIVEGMDDIISLGLETMEVQTVRMVAPQHFEQYWQAGVLANKAGFEMNIHGPYYSELLGDKLQRNRSLAKVEAALQLPRQSMPDTLHCTPDIMVKPEEDKRLTNKSHLYSRESFKEFMKSGMMMRICILFSLG